MIRVMLSLMTSLSVACLACEAGPRSGYGLRLPAGDLEAGKLVFQELSGTTCHDVAGVPMRSLGERRSSIVTLGGEVPRVDSYGQLGTSIVNPSHRISGRCSREDVTEDEKSRMTNFNDVMTVAQLIDITAFLQSRHERRYEPMHVP